MAHLCLQMTAVFLSLLTGHALSVSPEAFYLSFHSGISHLIHSFTPNFTLLKLLSFSILGTQVYCECYPK
jgi:hypothetical protein